jgi:hypothetical protein
VCAGAKFGFDHDHFGFVDQASDLSEISETKMKARVVCRHSFLNFRNRMVGQSQLGLGRLDKLRHPRFQHKNLHKPDQNNLDFGLLKQTIRT